MVGERFRRELEPVKPGSILEVELQDFCIGLGVGRDEHVFAPVDICQMLKLPEDLHCTLTPANNVRGFDARIDTKPGHVVHVSTVQRYWSSGAVERMYLSACYRMEGSLVGYLARTDESNIVLEQRVRRSCEQPPYLHISYGAVKDVKRLRTLA